MSNNQRVQIVERNSGKVLVEAARWCSSRLCRLVGLQFHRPLHPGEGIILAKAHDSISTTSIHMFFVFFPIAAIWVNSDGKVTSAQLARPWRPYYASPEPARYVIETTPDVLEHVQVGDILDFRS